MYHWIVFLHVLAVLTFVMLHGASVGVALKLRRETSRERIAALLDLSGSTYTGMYISLLVILLAGIALGFMGDWWGQFWIWLVLAVTLAKLAAMFMMGARSFGRLRKVVGLPFLEGMKSHPAIPPASPEEIAAIAAAIQPLAIALIGYGGLAVMLWLMMFKPF